MSGSAGEAVNKGVPLFTALQVRKGPLAIQLGQRLIGPIVSGVVSHSPDVGG